VRARRGRLALALLVAAACAPLPPPLEDGLALSLRAPPDAVDFGAPFALTVVRAWRDDLVPQPWDEAALAPLDLRLLERSTRRAGGAVVETRRYEARAFVLGEVALEQVALRARPRDGGRARVASATLPPLRVRSILPPDDPGLAELPGGPLGTPPRRPPDALLAALALLAGLGIGGRLGRPRPAPEPAGPAAGPAARAPARARLARLREAPPAAAEAFAVEVSAIVRTHLDERLGLPAPARSTERLVAAPATRAALDPARRERLAAFLGACDRIKFAGEPADAGRRARLLDAAATLVAETDARAARDGTP